MLEDASTTSRDATPPRPRLCLTIGVIGQRLAETSGAVARAAEICSDIRKRVEAIDPLPWFRADRADLRVLTSLATDIDRQLAEHAVAQGYLIDVVRPVGAGTSPVAPIDRHLHLACSTTADDPVDPLPRQAVVAHSGVIIAVWDGSGRCDAAEAVARAIDAGVPVIHVPIAADQPVRLLWTGFHGVTIAQSDLEAATATLLTSESLDQLLAAILLPPDDPVERAQLSQYFAEGLYARNLRIGYPLLLAVTGTQMFRRKSWNKALYPPEIKLEWEQFNATGGAHSLANTALLAPLAESFLWANHLGSHFAQTMRSALVINFSFSALAVLVALASLASAEIKLPLALLEIIIIVIMIINIRRGSREGWQRRWLDYRSIAERLRPFRSIKLLGIAQKPRRIQRKDTAPRRWIDWYVDAIWREMGTPRGTIDAQQLECLRGLVADAELSGEIAYHRTNARRMRHLEDRLHLIGDCSFIATIIVCSLFPILYLGTYDLAMAWSNGFVMLSAGLPALGGACYALRVHGDYAGAAGRSLETAAALDGIRGAILEPGVSLVRAAALTTAAARVMLVDLDEWQMTYAQRSLAIPA